MFFPHRDLEHRATQILRELVRINTTNPPGNETSAARYLADLLSPAKIEKEIIESRPGRGNLIARLRGTGDLPPLLLMGHLDVVAVQAKDWSHPPFGAELHDGFVWGRGTTDMKGMLAVCTTILLALARLRSPLKHDVLLMATADEECGRTWGMHWLAKERPELFQVACALNEDAGHLRCHVTDTMRMAVEKIAESQSPQTLAQVRAYLNNQQIESAMSAEGLDASTIIKSRSLFYDTVSLTVLEAGSSASINVIPSAAPAFLDGRILPGQTDRGFVNLLRRRAAGQDLGIQVYKQQYSPGMEAATRAPITELMGRVLAARYYGAKLIPWQCAGSTDAKNLRPWEYRCTAFSHPCSCPMVSKEQELIPTMSACG